MTATSANRGPPERTRPTGERRRIAGETTTLESGAIGVSEAPVARGQLVTGHRHVVPVMLLLRVPAATRAAGCLLNTCDLQGRLV